MNSMPKIDITGASNPDVKASHRREVIVAAALEIIRAQVLGPGAGPQTAVPTANLGEIVSNIEAALAYRHDPRAPGHREGRA